MKAKYLTPITERITPKIESLMMTASPGISNDPADEDDQAKGGFFDDWDAPRPGSAEAYGYTSYSGWE